MTDYIVMTQESDYFDRRESSYDNSQQRNLSLGVGELFKARSEHNGYSPSNGEICVFLKSYDCSTIESSSNELLLLDRVIDVDFGRIPINRNDIRALQGRAFCVFLTLEGRLGWTWIKGKSVWWIDSVI